METVTRHISTHLQSVQQFLLVQVPPRGGSHQITLRFPKYIFQSHHIQLVEVHQSLKETLLPPSQRVQEGLEVEWQILPRGEVGLHCKLAVCHLLHELLGGQVRSTRSDNRSLYSVYTYQW